ncbi:hypothetical protein R1flu_026036 [Riccia fluitans]|uniref:Uncharacterized protein n=1 Tax=Riccia fluitans TaxID=41844 RepID=A0ABD1XET9_9MARC
MGDSYRQAGGRRGAEMAVTVSKQADFGVNKNEGESWYDMHNELSPVRKHLIHTYLQIQDEEALPLLGEYFGVALSFMAMGALVRASNATKKRRKSMSDEERLDLRACSRFQRMALESMLREAMERLRGLAQNTYQLEERVRDLVEAEMEKDNEKIVFLSRVAEAEKAAHELKALRKAEGRANERVMSIVAAKEQDWLKEKRNLQKEIERLKENLNTVCREVKFQSRRCRNPTCEHCKGIERVVRNVRGRVSLRELNSREVSAYVPPRRELIRVEQPSEVEEVEEERVLVKALEQKKKRIERPGHLQVQDKVERHEKPGSWTGSRGSVNPSGGSAGGAGQFMTKELMAKQQQDMESELANILKRVGMLKQRSNSSNLTSTGQQNASSERKNDATSANPTSPSGSKDSAVSMDFLSNLAVSESRQSPAVTELEVPDSLASGTDLELADDLTTGLLTFEQEALLSAEEDSDLLELEKAFQLEVGLGSAGRTNSSSNTARDDKQRDVKSLLETNTNTAEEADGEAEFAQFESHLASDGEVANLETFNGEVDYKSTESNEAKTNATEVPGPSSNIASVDASTQARDVSEPEAEVPPSPISETTLQPSEATVVVANLKGLGESETCERSAISFDAVTDSEDWAESAVVEDDCNEPVIEESVSSEREDKPLAEEVKVVDGGNVPEPEEVLEIVEVDRNNELPERQDTPGEDVQNVEASSTEAELNGRAEDTASTVEERHQDAEIPVFERVCSEDIGGDLPEPDEKRVCGSGESEVDIVEDTHTFEITSLKRGADDLVSSGDEVSPVVSETTVDSVELDPNPLEKVEAVEDTAFSTEEEKSSKVAEEVGSAVTAE